MDLVFLAPQYLLYVGLTIVPFFVALPMVFTNQIAFSAENARFVGLQNFASLFREPLVTEFVPALVRTAVFTVLNYLMVFVFGLPLALLMFEYHSRLKQPFFVIMYLPWMISGVGIGLLLTLLFARDTGSYNLLLVRLGLLREPIDIQGPASVAALPVVVGWRAAGFNAALFLSGLLTIPTDTIEASTVDGASYLQRLRNIYLPQIVPSITIATISCLIGSFGIFDELVGLGGFQGNRNVQFLSILLYRYGFDVAQQTGTLSQAVTISLVTYLPLVVFALFLNQRQKKLTL